MITEILKEMAITMFFMIDGILFLVMFIHTLNIPQTPEFVSVLGIFVGLGGRMLLGYINYK